MPAAPGHAPARGAALPTALLAACLLLLAEFALRPFGEGAHAVARSAGLVLLYSAAAALCLLRAPQTATPAVWRLLGLGIAGYGAASLLDAVVGDAEGAAAAASNLSLLGWLGFYALAYLALRHWLRALLTHVPGRLWLDAVMITVLLLGTLHAFVLPGVLTADIGIARPTVIAGLLFVIGDAVLLGIGLWGMSLVRWRVGPQAWLLVAACAALLAGDTVLVWTEVHGTWERGHVAGALFPSGMALLAAAAWQRTPALRRPPVVDSVVVLAIPAACATVAIAALALDPVLELDALATGLLLAALALALVRGLLTFVTLQRLYESRRFERGFEDALVGMALVTCDLRWRRVNDACAALLGREARALAGRPVTEVAGPDGPGLALLGEASEDDDLRFEQQLVRPDGTIVDVELTAVRVQDEGGRTLVFVQLEDITRRKRAERFSRSIADLGRRLLPLADVPAIMREAALVVTEALGGRCAVTCGAADGLAVEAGAGGGAPVRVPLRRRGTGWALVAHPPKAPCDEDVRFLHGVANVLAAALDRAGAEAETRHRALHDPLTGLANRAHVEAQVDEALARAGGATVLLLDLDRFKGVNDSLGHSAGDALLRHAAARLRDATGGDAVVGRFGGDEFVVALLRPAGVAEVRAVATRLVDALRAPFDLDGRELFAEASVGVVAGSPPATAEELLRDADVAMYRAKQAGGDRYELYDAALRARVERRLATENELRRAVERDQLVLHFQPLVDLADGRLRGFEALLRWQHPERGLLLPGEFVDIAEETDLIRPIGAWVLEQAVAQAAAWAALVPGAPPAVGVNLSPRQITPELPVTLAAHLRAAGVPASLITLEITESLLLAGDAAAGVLSEVRALGTVVALDDFGTGYSSLAYVQDFPLDVLKLDRSFVTGLGAGDRSTAVVRAVVDMARALGLEVVAEGVEDVAQATLLRDLGCPLAQGYLFARPLPAADATRLLLEAPATPLAA